MSGAFRGALARAMLAAGSGASGPLSVAATAGVRMGDTDRRRAAFKIKTFLCHSG